LKRSIRIEDALEAVKAAQAQGVVAGGGAALLRASRSIMHCESQGPGAIRDGPWCLRLSAEACKEPVRQMAINSGESPDLIINANFGMPDDTFEGWDFRT
jgi:chaperonin GroEL